MRYTIYDYKATSFDSRSSLPNPDAFWASDRPTTFSVGSRTGGLVLRLSGISPLVLRERLCWEPRMVSRTDYRRGGEAWSCDKVTREWLLPTEVDNRGLLRVWLARVFPEGTVE